MPASRSTLKWWLPVDLLTGRPMSTHASATATVATRVRSKACTYDCRAALTSAAAVRGGSARVADRAAPREWLATLDAAGNPAMRPARSPRYSDARMLPTTATPSAPPSSLVVSLTAEPTPALASGSDTMIAPVDGAVVIPMPAALTTIDRARNG